MNPRVVLSLLCVLLSWPAISAKAQEPGEVRLWLTTPDRSQLLTLQKAPLQLFWIYRDGANHRRER